MRCKDCEWFQSGYSSHDRGICVARGVYEYLDHWCWLKKENTNKIKLKNSIGITVVDMPEIEEVKR